MKELIRAKEFALHLVDSRKPLTHLKVGTDSVRTVLAWLFQWQSRALRLNKDNIVG